MHAVMGTIEIEAGRADEAIELLNSFAMPNARQAPGFITGRWCRSADGTRGHSVVLFETEATANAAAERHFPGFDDLRAVATTSTSTSVLSCARGAVAG